MIINRPSRRLGSTVDPCFAVGPDLSTSLGRLKRNRIARSPCLRGTFWIVLHPHSPKILMILGT